MKIYLPLDTHRKTQGWAENKACISYQGKVISKRGNDCPVGYLDFYTSMGMKGHNGEDWACFFKEPIFFSIVATNKDGKVIKWYSKDSSDVQDGLGVDVFSGEPIPIDVLPEGTGSQARKLWEAQNRSIRVKFRYWHLESGWRDKDVVLGEMVGLGDSTGASSGNHLHWGMKFVDANDNTLDKDNGFYGAVDFSRWTIDPDTNKRYEFILDKIKKPHKLTNAQYVYRVAYYFRLPILNEVGKLLEVK